MNNLRYPLCSSLIFLAASFPQDAFATGREMGPLGGIVLLLGIAGVVLLQLLTIVTYSNLPGRWPRLLRAFLAVAIPLAVFGLGWLWLVLI